MLISEYRTELSCSDTDLMNGSILCTDHQQSPNKDVVSPSADVTSEALVLGMLMNVLFGFQPCTEALCQHQKLGCLSPASSRFSKAHTDSNTKSKHSMALLQ